MSDPFRDDAPTEPVPAGVPYHPSLPGTESAAPAVPYDPSPPPGVAAAHGAATTVAGDVLPAPGAAAPAAAAVAPAILALPLSGRRLLPVSLDLLLRAEGSLRAASFYIGFLLVVTAGPVIALAAAAAVLLGDAFLDPLAESQAWTGWWLLTMVVAVPGYLVAAVESRILATAVIAAAIEQRPLTTGGLLALSRRRFWRAAAATVVVGIPATIGQSIGEAVARAVLGPSAEIAFAGQIVGGVLFGVPFVYALAGVVLGEVGAVESVRRSWRLFAARPRLALMVAAFGLASQFVLLVALGAGADIVVRVFDLFGFDGSVPVPLVVAVSGVLVFAFGTLVFLAEAIAATPAVHAFVALTHYVHGLEAARDPADAARGRGAWLTRPLILGIVLAVGGLLGGLVALSG